MKEEKDEFIIWNRFKEFWDIRKPYWMGSDIDLVEDILTDPDFLDWND